MQVLQKRIVKYMTFSNRTSSASNIFKLLKILKVSDLYQLYLEKFMYKYNADILPSSFDNFFSKLYNIHDHGPRQVSGNFHHKRVRTDYGKKMLQYVGPAAWVVFPIISKSYHYMRFQIKQNRECLLGIDSYVWYTQYVIFKMFLRVDLKLSTLLFFVLFSFHFELMFCASPVILKLDSHQI